MGGVARKPFNVTNFLATNGPGRRSVRHTPNQVMFSQGTPADAVFYLLSGRSKLTALSKKGKEATVSLLAPSDFFGEEALLGTETLRTTSAVAVSVCTVIKITRTQMLQVLHQEHTFSDFFMRFIVARGVRTQQDLIDQLFNSSEKRLARTLLLMAEFGTPGEPETLIPVVTQETLADMIGTTRSRASFFMNRFRKLGYITYTNNSRIRVHKSLLNMFLKDQLPEENTSKPKLLDPPPSAARKARRAKLV